MGIIRQNGYSATVEGFLIIGQSRFRLAKTNHQYLTLVDACEVEPDVRGEIERTIDSNRYTTRVILPDGICQGQTQARYLECQSSS